MFDLKKIFVLMVVFSFICPVGEGDLLLSWRFDISEGKIKPDFSGHDDFAQLVSGDYNLPYPERQAVGGHGKEGGAVRLARGSRIASMTPLELPESWTLSFWVKDERAVENIPSRSGSDDFMVIESQMLGLDQPWYFRTDPDEEGTNRNWHQGENGSEWEEIQVPAFWSETHVGGSYYGYGWYKTRFCVPEKYADMEHELHFEAVDEQAWVYVNGQLVGEQTTQSTGKGTGDIWDEPFSVKISPENLRGGEENMLFVRSHASGGQAGIFRPVYFIPLESHSVQLNLAALSGERASPGQWEHIALTVTPDQVQALREELVEAGMYGRRAAVIEADPVDFAVQPYLFSLIASEDISVAGFSDDSVALARLLNRRFV